MMVSVGRAGHGIRNIRQALASPYPGFFSRSAWPERRALEEPIMSKRLSSLALVITLIAMAASAAGCALRAPHISDLRANPGRYQGRSVRVDGVVTSSWGVSVLPLRYYRVSDGTGELIVLSRGIETPTRGAHVTVRGKVGDLAVLGGEPLGLHLREEDLDIRGQ
jgi:hypothetical protein